MACRGCGDGHGDGDGHGVVMGMNEGYGLLRSWGGCGRGPWCAEAMAMVMDGGCAEAMAMTMAMAMVMAW